MVIIINYISLSENERFEGGTLVGTYDGIAEKGELITFEASGVSLEGHYLVLQKDERNWLLHVGDFAALGEYTAKKTGKYTIHIQYQSDSARF